MGGSFNPTQHAIFNAQFHSVRRDEAVGVLLALFLGGFGVHHFYLRRTGLGVLYLLFFWTGVPAILGFFECFFMPGRVREFNAIQAAGIAAMLGMSPAAWSYGPIPGPMQGAAPEAMNVPPWQQQAAAGQPGSSLLSATLQACAGCQQTNPAGARFCSNCGRQQ